MPERQRMQFTLPELFAVVTIVAIATFILLPARNDYGDRVRITPCGRALMDIGKAVHAYKVQHHGAWPSASTQRVDGVPGTGVPNNPKSPASVAGYSWIVKILPYLDERHLYSGIEMSSQKFTLPAFDARVSELNSNGARRHLSTRTLKGLKCPGFDDSKTQQPMMSDAPEYTSFANAVEGFGVGTTNYVAVSATWLPLTAGATPNPDGVICYRGVNGPVMNIPDGSSKTIVLTETREPNYASWYDGTTAGVVAHDPNTPSPVIVKSGNRPTIECSGDCRHAINSGPDDKDPGYAYRATWAGKQPWQYGPSSEHAGGVNHLFGDGHVMAIQSSVDATVYLQLVTRGGGESPQGF